MYGTGLKEEIALPEYAKKLKGELFEAYALKGEVHGRTQATEEHL